LSSASTFAVGFSHSFSSPPDPIAVGFLFGSVVFPGDLILPIIALVSFFLWTLCFFSPPYGPVFLSHRAVKVLSYVSGPCLRPAPLVDIKGRVHDDISAPSPPSPLSLVPSSFHRVFLARFCSCICCCNHLPSVCVSLLYKIGFLQVFFSVFLSGFNLGSCFLPGRVRLSAPVRCVAPLLFCPLPTLNCLDFSLFNPFFFSFVAFSSQGYFLSVLIPLTPLGSTVPEISR